MSQPYPSAGQATKPLRPPAPAPVLTAVKLMYAGAAVNAVAVIISLALISGIKAALRKANPGLTAAQVGDLNTLITLAIAVGLVVIALWLWMARTNGQGRTWARILSTVLFGLATLELPADIQLSHLGHLVLGGQVQPERADLGGERPRLQRLAPPGAWWRDGHRFSLFLRFRWSARIRT